MVPLAVSRPASWPSNEADRSCKSFMEGSSPYTSSPTVASAMARRISSVGLVTVSLRRSINVMSRIPPKYMAWKGYRIF